MKLSKKYFISEWIKYLIIITFVLFTFFKVISDYILESSKKEINKVGRYFNHLIVERNSERADKFYKELQKNKDFLNSVKTSNVKLLKNYLDLSEFDILQLYDKNNIILFEKLNSQIKDEALKKQFQKTILQKLKTSNETYLTDSTNLDIYYFKKYVLKNNNQKLGNLIIGFVLSKNEYVEEIRKNFGFDATIFYDNIRVKTTIKKSNLLQTGTSLDKKIYNIIYKHRSMYNDKTDILGEPYMTVYIPLFNDSFSKGAIFVGKPMKEIYSKISKTNFTATIMLLLITLIINIVSYRGVKKVYIDVISKIDEQIKEFLHKKSEYNVNKIIEKNQIDEIVSLKDSFDIMQKNIIEYENKLEYQLYHDSLTKLKNINCLYKECKYNENYIFSYTSIYILNINNISSINTNINPSVGDLALLKVVEKIQENLSFYENQLYRYTGNKFLILFKSVPVSTKYILKLFNRPFSLKENKLSISISIGICDINENYKDVYEILKNAGVALKFAKDENTSKKTAHFNKNMVKTLNLNFEIENDLKTAILNNHFFLTYQPKIDCVTNKIRGFEALIRWKHPEKGIIPPDTFIDTAEKTGEILHIGKWVLKEAVSFISKLNKKMNKNFHIAINVSVAQLIQDDFVEYAEHLLIQNNVNGNIIHLEITETLLIKSYEAISKKLIKLKEIGIKIDLDDFGTGYSSLNYLINLPIDALKIDKSFIDNIFKENNLILEIINIGKRIGLTTIAEGVETKEQFDVLKKYECNVVQGYYFSKPLVEDDLFKYLDQYSSK